MIESARARGDAAPSPAEAWFAITAGSARALGWEGCGELAVGLDADVVVVQPDLDLAGSPDPLGTLLYGWDDRWIGTVLLAGAVAYESD
jgi:cytosine/adenosine deaminase-related metal-dependent hydrolase